MLNDILQDVLYAVVTGALVTIVRCVFMLIRAKVNSIQLDQRIKCLPLIEDMIEASVNTVAQSYVDDLKAAGSFGTEEARIAKERARDLLYQSLSQNMQNVIGTMSNDVDAYINMKIESQIKNSKGGRKDE